MLDFTLTDALNVQLPAPYGGAGAFWGDLMSVPLKARCCSATTDQSKRGTHRERQRASSSAGPRWC